ncbi:MAG: small ribosomal subunit Rsm22 family protein [Bacillota bacterium]|nr:small ribosomal subunit Rsm22 family protein [Bacillota bacterium]
MEIPVLLREEITKLAQDYQQNQLKQTAQNITEKYKNESGQGKHLVSTNMEAAVYAMVRMPATFGAVSSALESTLEMMDMDIHSVLDMGAGTGAASWAIRSVLDGELSFTCVERESAMIHYGKQLGKLDETLSKSIWIQRDLNEDIPEHADLVVVSYALNEFSEEKRIQVLQKLWNATDKLFLILEPGTPVGSSQLKKAKDLLVEWGGHIVAPCPHNDSCPMSDSNWCHFTTRVARSKIHKTLKNGDVPYEDEKFSYLAVSKEKVDVSFARILRHPIKEAGKITLQLCTKEGIETRIVTKKNKDCFKKARKSSAGDSFGKESVE